MTSSTSYDVDINLRKRLQTAHENICFSADNTWSDSPTLFHRNNLDLYLTEKRLQRRSLQKNRPRTVRECIPNSRLAQYANYTYNESREMSYSSCNSREFVRETPSFPSEVWELPDVTELYIWFLKNQQAEDEFCRHEGYESPLLRVYGFEDKILKIQIGEDRVKSIWIDYYRNCRLAKTNQLTVNFFTSPMRSFYLFRNEEDLEWFRNRSVSRDFEQLDQLIKSLKEENNVISKYLNGSSEATTSSETTSTEILYSEVLQGLSHSKKLSSSVKSEPMKTTVTDEQSSSMSQDSFSSYTVMCSQRSAQEEIKNDIFSQNSFPPVTQFSSMSSQTSTKFVSPKNHFSPETSSYTYMKCRYPHISSQYHMETVNQQRNRVSIFPFSTSYVQQAYFYSPVQPFQRWIPLNLTNSYYPHLLTPNWGNQNNASNSYDLNKNFAPQANAKNDRSTCDMFGGKSNFNFDCNNRVEDSDLNQLKEETLSNDPFLEESRVSASPSEELEIQALEQYSSSTENFYQELERQAAEQYSSSPE